MRYAAQIYREVRQLLETHRSAIWKIGLLSAVLNILTLGGSFFMLLVYDEVLPSRSLPTLAGLLLMIVTVYIFQAVIELLRGRATIQISAMMDDKLSDHVFRIITRQELRTGLQREGMQPMRDLDQVRAYLSSPGPLALFDLPWVLLFLGTLFLLHPALGLLGTGGVIVLVGLTWLTNRWTVGPVSQVTTLLSARHALAEGSRRNSEVLFALGMERRARNAWSSISHRYLAASDRLAFVGGGLQSISKTFRMLLQSLMLATGAMLVISDKASGGIIIAASILSSRALAPVEQAIAHWKGLTAMHQAWIRLQTLMARFPEDPRVMELPAPREALRVEALAVSPPGSQQLSVTEMSFQLKAGDVLGVMGPSGSGKTSLARALVGIWQPARGVVRLDGASLGQWSPDAVGLHLGYVPQDVELFDGTLAQNIARFEEDADPDAIIAAANAANVHDLIVRFPQGYGTVIGPNGGNLSAGQRQRIALARALYRDPFLIVLDEPNSNLDQEGCMALARAIAGASARGAIVVIVAHHLTAVSEANLIMYVTDGRTRLFGPREEVLAQLRDGPQRRAPVESAKLPPIAPPPMAVQRGSLHVY